RGGSGLRKRPGRHLPCGDTVIYLDPEVEIFRIVGLKRNGKIQPAAGGRLAMAGQAILLQETLSGRWHRLRLLGVIGVRNAALPDRCGKQQPCPTAKRKKEERPAPKSHCLPTDIFRWANAQFVL